MLHRITRDPEIMGGRPIVKGTRITVQEIVERLAEGESHKAILRDFAFLREEDIYASLAFAALVIEKLKPPRPKGRRKRPAADLDY